MTTASRDRDFIAVGVYGLPIGDVLGVPYEFPDASDIPPADQIEFNPPAGFHRSHPVSRPALGRITAP
jgi:ADP-ribosyl-[dinitrogen reductase] hydrolase